LLVSNRRYCSAAELLSKTFLAQELSVQHQFTLPDGSQQLVRGRFDSLLYDFEQHRLCVVEYKTYQSLDQSAQLAQVALYSYMLKERVGVPINSAVYSVLPELKELTFSWDELEHTVHQLIPHKLLQMQQWVAWQQGQPEPPPPASQPHLCQICPQRTKCQTFFLTSEHPAPLPIDSVTMVLPDPVSAQSKQISDCNKTAQSTGSPSDVESNADAIGESLVYTLKSFGIEVMYHGAAIGPAFIRVKLKPAPGVKVNSILKLSNDLRVQLGIVSPPLIAPQAGYVSVDLPRPDRQAAYFEQYLQPEQLPPNSPTRIAIGVDLEGHLIEADLSDPNTCHFLVGGTTGSGKSEFLRSLLLSLLRRYSPSHLKVALVDPKRVTFPEFETMPWLYTAVVKQSERAIELMENLVAEMHSRYQKFELNRCNDLSSYNQKFISQADKLLPRIVCIFDEYADFMAEKETAQALELSIKQLGAMARAAGIHLIIATQRPEAKIVTPIIRSNLPGRVALRTASEADSMIILGGKQVEAAYLLGKGDLLFQAGANSLRLQSLFAPTVNLPL
jgi:S-DNA-T family DNA segregation ATPase FtsK/SpoIIIE